MQQVLFAILVSLLGAVAWVVGLLGLPGNWMIVILAALTWGLVEPPSRLSIGTATVISLVVLAGLGELLEFVAGALGVRRAGGGPRSASYALGGSILGAVVGLVLGSGIPVVGNVVASVVGSALGALIGAVYAERTIGQQWQHSMQVGSAAFIGRILGTLGKAVCGTLMLVIFLLAVWI